MSQLPTGTVTFLFTDIEGSTRLLQFLGDGYGQLLADHHRLIREAIRHWHGVEVSTEGDAFFVVFRSAVDAIGAAVAMQRAVAAHAWPAGATVRVRMGMHAGEAATVGDQYVGLDIHRAARISAAAYGGQVLVSESVLLVVPAEARAGWTARDLGQHALKDLDRPEHLYQLVIDGLPDRFPPIRSRSARFRILPAEVSSFVGREALVARAGDLVGTSRLLTLTGPGGTGKTRLSLQVARSLEDRFAAGVAFVALASITDPILVPSTIRQALGLREEPGRPSIETVVDGVRDLSLLLVLDNFEQIMAAAVDVARLLAETTALRLLVTSRSPLRIAGEQEFPVPPMQFSADSSDPPPGESQASESVRLFLARARMIRPDLASTPANLRAIAEICLRLDGLPLAIELAASRVGLLPPEALLVRLGRSLDLLASGSGDRPDRQRTLRGAIGWSHELLDPASRVLFRRSSVFVGGWDLDDVDAIAGAAGAIPLDVLEGMSSLVDQSLIRQDAEMGEPRFAMLETIREYARERLVEAGEASATELAHATWFLEMTLRLAPGFTGGGGELTIAERQRDNIRTALRWAIDHAETELALAASGALWRYWHLRGHLREGQRLTTEALALPGAETSSRARARALYGLGSLSYWLGDFTQARQCYAEALALARALGDDATEAETLYAMGFVNHIDHRYDEAAQVFQQSRAIAERTGDRLGAANAMMGAGFTAWLDGRPEEARATIADVLAIFETLGDTFATVNAYGLMGRILQASGDLDAGRRYHIRELTGAQELGDRTLVAMALNDLASIDATLGRWESALRLAGAASRETDRLGGGAPVELTRVQDPRVLALAAGLEQGTVDRLLAEGRGLSDRDVVHLAERD